MHNFEQQFIDDTRLNLPKAMLHYASFKMLCRYYGENVAKYYERHLIKMFEIKITSLKRNEITFLIPNSIFADYITFETVLKVDCETFDVVTTIIEITKVK